MHTMACPSCSGPMELKESKPGDKIAACPYCGKVIDLPDGKVPSDAGAPRVQAAVKMAKSGSSIGGKAMRVCGHLFLVSGIGMILGGIVMILEGALHILGSAEDVTGGLIGGGITLVITGGMFVPGAILFYKIDTWISKAAEKHQRLEKFGLPGVAEVLRVAETGWSVNNNPVIETEMTITVQGREPLTLVHKLTVPRLMVGRLTAGNPLPVKIDPDNLANFMVDWDAS